MTREACTFCRIVSGEQPTAIVLDDDPIMAFLDHRPLFHGHTLVVPKAHYETLLDLPAHLISPLFGAVQLLAAAVERALGADGAFVAINHRVSQSVPHLHVHVVPRRYGDELRGFFWPRQRYKSEEEMRAVAAAIRAALPQDAPSAPGAHP